MRDIATKLVKKLSKHGAWVYHKAATGSIYIKFGDPKLCSLRIADHNGRERYRYKWNLMLDGLKSYKKMDGNVCRRFYTADDIDKMVRDIGREARYLRGDEMPLWYTKVRMCLK